MLAALLAAASSAPVRPVTTPMLFAHVHQWNGRRVAVRGWTHGCGAPVPNLQGRCYLTPTRDWRQGRDRLRLDGFPRSSGDSGDDTVRHVVVSGTVEEDWCAPSDICLDGEHDLRADTVEQVGKRHA